MKPVGVPVASVLLGLALASCGDSQQECESLTSDDWKATQVSERGDLAERIVECGALAGWKKEKAVDWLGDPDFVESGSLYWRLDSDYLDEPRYMSLEVARGRIKEVAVP